MTAAATLDDFLIAWKTAFDADSSLSAIDGPYSDREPPESAPDFPYAIVTATRTQDGMTNSEERYRVILDVSVYDATKSLAAGHMANIMGVFTCELGDMPAMAAGKGTVVGGRIVGDYPTQEDGPVFRHRGTWEYTWTVPRI